MSNEMLKGAGTALASVLLLLGTLTGTARAQGESFTPIPIIKGMKLLAEGTPAPVFKVKDTSGSDFDFSEHVGKKPYIIVFWSIFCEPCREEMPIIEQVYNEFKSKNVEVLAVNLDGVPFLEGIKGYINQYGYSFTVVIDELDGETFRIADPYQVAGTPVLYLVDRKGRIYTGHLGRITVKDLRVLVAKMLTKK